MKNAFIKVINENRKIRIIYNDLERIIEPYYLFSFYNFKYKSLYVAGFCHQRKEQRIFKLSRISSRKQLNEKWDLSPYPITDLDLSSFENGNIEFLKWPSDKGEELLSLGFKLKDMESKRDYPKQIKLSKMNKPGTCRSPLEERVLTELNLQKEIVELEMEPYKISYSFNNEIRTYIPDILVYYIDGTKKIIEIKLSGEIVDPQNQVKFERAKEFAHQNGMTFLIRGVDTEASNYRQTGEFGWNDNTRSLPIREFEPMEFLMLGQSNLKNEPPSFAKKKSKNIFVILLFALAILIILKYLFF
ncbi:WYL domain-containing protein [Rossellomorea sp. LjRoot5]|uniref:TnsA endonuclease N-terminal domain-containing protein n=1 Tax=Rossellomorea sp. LjRoot5 TaxID=3342331 RepID=UPI003ED04B71